MLMTDGMWGYFTTIIGLSFVSRRERRGILSRTGHAENAEVFCLAQGTQRTRRHSSLPTSLSPSDFPLPTSFSVIPCRVLAPVETQPAASLQRGISVRGVRFMLTRWCHVMARPGLCHDSQGVALGYAMRPFRAKPRAPALKGRDELDPGRLRCVIYATTGLGYDRGAMISAIT
jgi:hypothetical protein